MTNDLNQESIYSSLIIEYLLAKGMSADVYLAHFKEGQNVVVKIFNQSSERYYLNEVSFIKTMPQSSNIIKVYGYGKVSLPNDPYYDRYYIVMDYAENGDLVNLIENRGYINEIEAKEILLLIIQGISDIHKAGFIHRDIKPENVLINRHNQCLLTDFGFIDSIRAISDERKGTDGYMPPEIMLKETVTIPEAIDVFSLGVIAFILVTGEFPFNTATDEDSMYKMILENNWEDFWDIIDQRNLSKSFKEMIEQILCAKPEKRLSLKGILNTSWFTSQN